MERLRDEIANITIPSQAYNYQLLFPSLTYRYEKVVGTCADWDIFLQGRDVVKAVTINRVTSFQLSTIKLLYDYYTTIDGTPEIVQCNETYPVQQLMRRVTSRDNTSDLVIQCHNRQWFVRNCDNLGPSLCVDCEDPCTDHCSNERALHFLSPCLEESDMCISANGVRHGIKHSINMLSILYEEIDRAPTIKSLDVTPSRYGLSIQVTLSASSGGVSCAIFENGTIPSSYDQIDAQNIITFRNSSIVDLTASNLLPSTPYELFCYTFTASSARLPFQYVLTNGSRHFSTTCCKTVTVSLSTTEVRAGSTISKYLTVSLDSLPMQELGVTIQLIHSVSGVAQHVFLLNYVSFTPLSTTERSFSANFDIAGGTYNISISLNGSSAAQYSLLYQPSHQLRVIATSSARQAPRIVRAEYSQSLEFLLLSFDRDTNRGGKGFDNFNCSLLLSFSGAGSSTCNWLSHSECRVYQPSSELIENYSGLTEYNSLSMSSLLKPGDIVIVRAGKVQAYCDATDCTGWPMVSSFARVSIDTIVPLPQTVLSMPTILGACDPLTIDISASTGSGAANWKNVTIEVQSMFASSASLTAIQSFISSTYVLSPPSQIPRSYFDAGVGYTFHARVCNFLGLCGSTMSKLSVLNVTSPFVRIQGLRMRTIKRSDELRLFTEAHMRRACDLNETKSGIRYIWNVSADNIVLSGISSSSQNPSVFYLPAFAFPSAQVYRVIVRVVDTITGFSVSDSITVNVLPEPLTIQISGAAIQSVAYGQFIRLTTTTTSYHAASLLSYNWTCYQIAPTLSRSCGVAIVRSSVPGVVDVYSRVANSSTVVEVTVASPDASASARVIVNVMPKLVPNITLLASVDRSEIRVRSDGVLVVNPGQKLKVLANASFVASDLDLFALPVATWGFITGATDINAYASTPISVDLNEAARITNAFGGIYTIPVNLVINENAFLAGNAMTLQLRADRYSIVFDIYANVPPTSGQFNMRPTQGSELGTRFAFIASLWLDADLPLRYSFGFLSLDNVVLPVRLEMEETTANSQLVCLRKDFKRDNVTTIVEVFDSFGAKANRTATVQVICNKRMTSSSFADILKDIIDSAEGDDSGLSRAIALGTGVVNGVDCSSSPNCADLHREKCKFSTNTCGPCLTGYSGILSDVNSPCIPSTTSSSRRLQSLESTTCSLDSQCQSWEFCHYGVCQPQLLSCPGGGSCSNNGVCSFVNKNTGDKVTNCTLTDVFCETQCSCYAGYFGVGCEYNATEWSAIVSSRQMMVGALIQIGNIIDMRSKISLDSFASQIHSVSGQAAQLNSSDIVELHRISSQVLQSAYSIELSRTVTSKIITALDAMLVLQHNDTEYEMVIDVLDLFREAVVQDMVPGEYDVKGIGSDLRYVVSLLRPSQLSSALATLPLSTFEEDMNHHPHQSSLPSVVTTNDSSISLFGVEIKSKRVPERNLTAYISNPIIWWYGSYRNTRFQFPDDNSTVTLTATLQYNQIIDIIPPFEEIHETICYDRDYWVQNYTCATSNDIITDRCPGEPGVIIDRCKIYNVSTVCNFLQTFANYNLSSCVTLDYNEQNVTCECHVKIDLLNSTSYDFASATMSRRRLSSISQKMMNFFAVDYAARQRLDIIGFDDFFTKSTDLSVEEVSYIIYGSTSVMIVSVLVFCVLFYYRDRFEARLFKEKLKPPEDKKKKRNLFAKAPRIEREEELAYDLPDEKTDSPGGIGGGGGGGGVRGSTINNVVMRKRAANYEDIELVNEESLYGSLPRIFTPTNILLRIWQEQCCYNRYLALFIHRSGNYNRMFRALEMGVRYLVVMAFLSFIYLFTNPDDGSCDDFADERNCIAQPSDIVPDASKCYWTYSTHRCHYRLPTIHPVTAIIVAVIAGAAAAPIAKMYEYFVLVKLCVPTATIIPGSSSGWQWNPFAAIFSALFGRFSSSVHPLNNNSAMIGEDIYDETPQALQRISMSTYDAYYADGIVDITRYKSSSFIKATPVEVELENIQNRIKSYCDALPFLGQSAELQKMIGKSICTSLLNLLRSTC